MVYYQKSRGCLDGSDEASVFSSGQRSQGPGFKPHVQLSALGGVSFSFYCSACFYSLCQIKSWIKKSVEKQKRAINVIHYMNKWRKTRGLFQQVRKNPASIPVRNSQQSRNRRELTLPKDICEKWTSNIILNGGRLSTFLLRLGTRLMILLFNTELENEKTSCGLGENICKTSNKGLVPRKKTKTLPTP